jgi:hypothetical protein
MEEGLVRIESATCSFGGFSSALAAGLARDTFLAGA